MRSRAWPPGRTIRPAPRTAGTRRRPPRPVGRPGTHAAAGRLRGRIGSADGSAAGRPGSAHTADRLRRPRPRPHHRARISGAPGRPRPHSVGPGGHRPSRRRGNGRARGRPRPNAVAPPIGRRRARVHRHTARSPGRAIPPAGRTGKTGRARRRSATSAPGPYPARAASAGRPRQASGRVPPHAGCAGCRADVVRRPLPLGGRGPGSRTDTGPARLGRARPRPA